MKSQNKKKDLAHGIKKVVFGAALFLFLFSAWKLIQIRADYQRGENEYEDIRRLVQKVETEDSSKTSEKLLEKDQKLDFPTYEAKEGPIAINGVSLELLLGKKYEIDFEKLLEINKDVKAWIIIEDTNINYPVVQTTDNETYLRQTLEGEWNNAGTIFIDCRMKEPFEQENTIIHGHNQRNHMMFHDLIYYKEKEYWKEHPYIQILTPDGKRYLYQIYAYYTTGEISKTYFSDFTNKSQYQQYLTYIENQMKYNTDITVKDTDKIITLSTCTNDWDGERVIIHGVLINERKTI